MPLVKELQQELLKAQKDLMLAESDVMGLKLKVARLHREIAQATPIKLVYEIKKCLVDKNNKAIPIRMIDIVARIEAKTHIEVGRTIKNKLVSTLSRMYNNKEITKVEDEGETYYGYPEAFSEKVRSN